MTIDADARPKYVCKCGHELKEHATDLVGMECEHKGGCSCEAYDGPLPPSPSARLAAVAALVEKWREVSKITCGGSGQVWGYKQIGRCADELESALGGDLSQPTPTQSSERRERPRRGK